MVTRHAASSHVATSQDIDAHGHGMVSLRAADDGTHTPARNPTSVASIAPRDSSTSVRGAASTPQVTLYPFKTCRSPCLLNHAYPRGSHDPSACFSRTLLPASPDTCCPRLELGCDTIPTFVDPSQAQSHPARFCARHKEAHFITLHQLSALRKTFARAPG